MQFEWMKQKQYKLTFGNFATLKKNNNKNIQTKIANKSFREKSSISTSMYLIWYESKFETLFDNLTSDNQNKAKIT